MKNVIRCSSILISLLLSLSVEAQYCTPDARFTEATTFLPSEIATDTNVVYGNANSYDGISQNLVMDIFYPSGPNETLTKRPFILLIHGGGFSTGNKNKMSIECRRFAQSGYVAATMSYRLGWDDTDPSDGEYVAAYRAQQDAHAALRYIVAYADDYGIDTSWMFMGGISAGGGTSLNTVFVNEAEWEAVIPGITSQWGNLNTSGNSLTNTFDIKAVYNNCGLTAESAIQPQDMKPVISFHGLLDNIAPIGSTAQGTAGSAVIHQKLIDNGVCSELTVDSLGNHCPHSRPFRVGRAACFLKNIMCNTCASNYFTEEVQADCSITMDTMVVDTNVIDTNIIDTTIIIGLNDVETKESYFLIYPNPASEQLTVKGELTFDQIEIFNSMGQLCKVVHARGKSQMIDMSDVAKGLYVVRIRSLHTTSFEIQRVVKE